MIVHGVKRTMEINPRHPFLAGLKMRAAAGRSDVAVWARFGCFDGLLVDLFFCGSRHDSVGIRVFRLTWLTLVLFLLCILCFS